MSIHVRRRFEPVPESAAAARQFLEQELSARLGPEPARDDLVLAVSELASNAILHARTPFEVVITTDGTARLEVEDWSTAVPAPPSTRSPTATSGRGMHIVEQVCDRWGVHITEGRKCVWCERDLRGGEAK